MSYRWFNDRHFIRLTDETVEVFHLSQCDFCLKPVSLNHLQFPEKHDDKLTKSGVQKLSSKPIAARKKDCNATTICRDCEESWIRDLEKRNH